MTRVLRNQPEFQPVDAYPVAPHRYLFTDMDESYRESGTSWKDFKAGLPYDIGDVIYLEYNGELRKAIISYVFREVDRFGDFREKYRIHLANKTGNVFGKSWVYTYPGFIQRGYKLAGLAPDVPN